MLVTNRFVVEAETVDEFTREAHAALTALAARPGYLRGELLRALDDPDHWLLVTEWESVGAYRRALGGFDVKVTAVPLLARSVDEPSAYETLAGAAPEGEIVVVASDRAAGPYR
ncbi:antibiotic biosynthesis monooxygenase family protein [Micromonospora tulbaghiae]|uniref:Antibiotic biosynthesis monooxygenase n=1 Tax=Micromonospora tulbaghiae TaxID=479978 RepID=A0AAW4JY51_9ACTN|nr:antibiotic biosynthesis monooxygenase family protein [Micromonospora tulbaghiae]MBO4143761.1 antibiotic biosynthesis monooxygenase [Micromonospora tulbaghiae]MDX5461476.1 antibiotic biosynthesis monooxygenase [Micromonospora tulbaghiae]SCE91143.1 Antibiotic biosynthesis monooxygenase [Micromonospora tulbaghiae]